MLQDKNIKSFNNLIGKYTRNKTHYYYYYYYNRIMEFSASLEFPKIPHIQEANEWAYIMRRTMQEIVPGLYLGPYSAATKSKLGVLLHNGITHVVCVRQDIEAHIIKPHFADRFK